MLYGRAQDTLAIQLNARTFKQFLRTYGENVVINMAISADNTETVIIREIQRHPVDKHMLIHADFIRISLDEPVTSAVPVILIGSPLGVEEAAPLNSLSPSDTSLSAGTNAERPLDDVSQLSIGDAVHVSDLNLDEEIDILDEPERIIATVSQPRVILDELTEAEDGEEGEMEEAAEEPTEPEIISRRRYDDDE